MFSAPGYARANVVFVLVAVSVVVVVFVVFVVFVFAFAFVVFRRRVVFVLLRCGAFGYKGVSAWVGCAA